MRDSLYFDTAGFRSTTYLFILFSMENSQKSLLEVVEDQKKTIEKYTNKLRDVVAAHKSLLTEKKALEDTIKILNAEKITSNNNEKSDEKEISESELKNHLSSVVASFSNLVAEKSRMEEGFKSNQKQLLEDKKRSENKCKELEEQIRGLVTHLKYVENKNNCELTQTKKDSQKSLRNSRQTNDDRDESKNLEYELLALQVKNYEKEIKNLKSELEAKQIIIDSSEKKLSESIKELSRLQDDIKSLQIEHEMAISNEKKKAENVEEYAKKLTAVQEERVLNLETRLAELSETIGTYDRLRLQDQIEIQKLKEHIAFIDLGCKESVFEHQKSKAVVDLNDYDAVKEKFLDTKKQLWLAAQKYEREEDFKNLLFENSNEEEMHLLCEEAYKKLKAEFEDFKNEVQYFNQGKSGDEVVILQNQVKNLQENVKILSNKNEEIEKDYNLQIEHLKKTLKNEKLRYKDTISALEADHKARVWLLEEQLQKQRERSLALLEEKEQEIQALQNTFLPGYRRKSEDDSQAESNTFLKSQFDGPHIVHYANELARKDIEISNLRRSKHQIEMTLRELQKQTASTVEKHKKEKQSLLNKIARLETYQTREGANLEYLKNIIYNFLLSDDPKLKMPLCKAIAAVLKFSESEMQNVISHRKNGFV